MSNQLINADKRNCEKCGRTLPIKDTFEIVDGEHTNMKIDVFDAVGTNAPDPDGNMHFARICFECEKSDPYFIMRWTLNIRAGKQGNA